MRATKYLAGFALALGALAVVAGSPRLQQNARFDVAGLAAAVEQEADHVSAIELARWIKDQRRNLRVIDVRDSASFDAYHIPRAELIDMEDLVRTPFKRDETLVLYSDGGAHAAQAWVFLRALGHRNVYFLRGGLYEWLDEVMSPALSPTPTDSMKSAFETAAEISRYFGGAPRIGDAESSQPSLPVPAHRDEHSATREAVARVRGRGC